MEILAAFSGLIPKKGGGDCFLDSFILAADSSVCMFYGYSAEGEFDAVVVVEIYVAFNGCFKLVGAFPFVSVVHFVFHLSEEAFTCSIIGCASFFRH